MTAAPATNVASQAAHLSFGRRSVPFAWQANVFPWVPSQTPMPASGSTLVRFDVPHLKLPKPMLLTQWKIDVGPHLRPSLHTGPLSASPTYLPANENEAGSKRLKNDAERNAPGSSRVAGRFRHLLAEAAHDIRSPLAVAQQIIAAIALRAKQQQPLTKDEAELLDVARLRLSQASRWAEAILVDQSLQHGQPVNIRKRFYPAQWRLEIEPLLQSIAAQRRVRLTWIGWDRSLPRLYLDANQLTRAVLNLATNAIHASPPDSDVEIRVAWQTNITQQLVLTIEDRGCGLQESLMHCVNAPGLWPSQVSDPLASGMGLKTAKALTRSLGGAIAVQRASAGGTLFRLTLPVDNYHSLVRSWLMQNARAAANRSGHALLRNIELRVIRCVGIDTAFVDAELQLAAGIEDLVYRVGKDRWLWLSLATANGSDTQAISKMDEVLRQLRSFGDATGKRSRLHAQLAFSLNNISLSDLQDAARSKYPLPHATKAVAEKIAELIGDRIPPVDELSERASAIVIRPLAGGRTRHIRLDQLPSSPGISRTTFTKPASSGAEATSQTAPEKLSELVRRWHAVHHQLESVTAKLKTTKNHPALSAL